MKVKALIKELKKMPQNLEVEVAMFDNSEWETAGNVSSVHHFNKDEHVPELKLRGEMALFDDMLDECVIIRC